MSVIVQPVVSNDAEVRRLRILYRLLAELSRAKALEDVYGAALASLVDATPADRAAILLFDDDGVLRFKASRGLSGEYQSALTGTLTVAARSSRRASCRSLGCYEGSKHGAYRGTLEREGIRALAMIPLALNAGVFGKFMLYYAQPHESTTDELEIAQAIAAHVALLPSISERISLVRMANRRLQAIHG